MMLRFLLKFKIERLIILLVLCSCSGFSQSLFSSKNVFGFQVKATMTTPMQIDQDQVIFSSKKKSRSTVGFEGEFSYHRLLKESVELNVGVAFGTYSYESDVFVGNELFKGDYDLDYFATEYDPFYAGIELGGNYFFTQNSKSALYGGLGMDLVYFLRQSFTENIHIINEDNSISTVYESLFLINEERQLNIAPKLSFGFYRKIGKRIIGKIGLNYLYSSGYPIKATYVISGDNGEKLEGHFKKRLAFGSLEIGFLF